MEHICHTSLQRVRNHCGRGGRKSVEPEVVNYTFVGDYKGRFSTPQNERMMQLLQVASDSKEPSNVMGSVILVRKVKSAQDGGHKQNQNIELLDEVKFKSHEGEE